MLESIYFQYFIDAPPQRVGAVKNKKKEKKSTFEMGHYYGSNRYVIFKYVLYGCTIMYIKK